MHTMSLPGSKWTTCSVILGCSGPANSCNVCTVRMLGLMATIVRWSTTWNRCRKPCRWSSKRCCLFGKRQNFQENMHSHSLHISSNQWLGWTWQQINHCAACHSTITADCRLSNQIGIVPARGNKNMSAHQQSARRRQSPDEDARINLSLTNTPPKRRGDLIRR